MSAGRRRALLAVAVLCAVGAVGYLAFAVLGSDADVEGVQPTAAEGEPIALAQAQLLVRAVDRGDRTRAGRVFALRAGHARQLAGEELDCERVYFAGGRGLCLRGAPSRISYEATIFDSRLRPLGEVPLAGLPSRARVSADGRYGAATVFVNGHEYLGAGGFSTAATIIDLRSGEELGNLESFAVRRDGRRFESPDFNFWGIAFDRRDSDRFYATLRTGDHHYLVEGSVRDRSLRVLRDGVECPSPSPDGTRIAFKRRIGGEDRWRLAVLDLATLEARTVGERRSIDDQPEWLDDATLVYSPDGLDVYTVAADGSAPSRLALRNASSPVSLAPGTGKRGETSTSG